MKIGGARRPQAKSLRPRTVVLALGLAACAQAQFDPSLLSGVDALKQSGTLQGAPVSPLQPIGFPHLPEKVPEENVEGGPGFQLINADTYGKKGDTLELVGNVEFTARGYHVRCDKASGNLRIGVYTVEGHVLITGGETVVYGERVVIDTVNDSYLAERAETQVDPSFLQNQVTDKVYVSGRLSAGTRLLTHTQDGFITTCDLERPHYGLEARDVEVRTGKRAILRDARLRILGKTIVQVPYLVIPLEDRTVRNLPYFGYTEDEGYFVKNVFTVPAKYGYVLTHEDVMTKKGVGLGADYVYQLPTVAGLARFYKILGSDDTLTLANSHRQVFRWGSVSLDNDYERNNYLVAPNQTILNSRGDVTYNGLGGGRAVSKLSFTRNQNDAQTYSSTSQTVGFTDQRTIGTFRSDFQTSYLSTQSAYQGGTATETERAQIRFLGSQELGLGAASIQYQRAIPIGETTNFVGSSDLTPVLSLQTDSRHLLGADRARDFPAFRGEVSWGQYADSRLATNTERTALALSFNKSTPGTERFTSDTAGNFRQGLYSDGTAQYILGLNENLRYRLGPDTGLNLRYNYLRPYGYTPLSIDSSGQSNTVSLDANARPIRPLLLGLQTGYDLLREKEGEIAWQQVGLRSEWTPRAGILFRGLYTYDTYQQAFSTLRFDFSSYGRQARLNLNAQYDGIRHTWSSFNGVVDGLQVGRTKISALFAYNGYTKQFETRQYAFTYDLHCAEAVLAIQESTTGFRPGRQIYFLLRIKALPFDLPFGVGNRGQGVGYGGSGTSF